jgi:hypothetical protein
VQWDACRLWFFATRVAVIEAEQQTGFPAATFPERCAFTFAEMLDEQFWPEGAG